MTSAATASTALRRVRSTISRIGQPSRSSVTEGRRNESAAQCTATGDGHGDTKAPVRRHGRPARWPRRGRATWASAPPAGPRRARRARRRSASRRTATRLRCDHRSPRRHHRQRGPIDQDAPPSCTPVAAAAPRVGALPRQTDGSPGSAPDATPRPRPRSDRRPAAAESTVQAIPPDHRRAVDVEVAGSEPTIPGGLAATRNGLKRPAPQRRDAQRASSMISADGPIPDHFANGTSRSTAIDPSGGPSDTTQPPTRRPCNED